MIGLRTVTNFLIICGRGGCFFLDNDKNTLKIYFPNGEEMSRFSFVFSFQVGRRRESGTAERGCSCRKKYFFEKIVSKGGVWVSEEGSGRGDAW